MRRRRSSEPQRCAVPGCPCLIPRWQRICGAHFKQLPWDLRKALAEAPPHLRVDRTREAVAWLAEHRPAAEAARRMGERDG